jgi:hypothetical protein
MNMLYEAIKEKGSMVIVPSSAVETMGLGGMLGTTALNGGKAGRAAKGKRCWSRHVPSATLNRRDGSAPLP